MAATSAAMRPHAPEVLRAEQLDRSGRHGDAIDSLVAGVRRHDVEATTRLGKRLLVGDRAPHLPREGLRFLQEAVDRGGAEAPALIAVCLAIGLDGLPDLNAARDSLVCAAHRGWPQAQAQLGLLAGATHGPDFSLARPADWGALARRIDLAMWRSAPPSADLHGDPLIRAYSQFADPAICRWIIDRARGRLEPAKVYDAVKRQTTTDVTRTNTSAVFNFLETDFVLVLVQMRMAACVSLPFRHLEAATVLHYDVGEQITEHFDFIDPNVPHYEQQVRELGQRMVTFLIYLNDDFTGGETEFPRLGVRHRGRCGDAVFFVNAFADARPDVRTLHAGRPTLRGEKWIVSQFIKNCPAF
jgi:hypothetical protein